MITPEAVVALLNRLHALDPDAAYHLIETRVRVNDALVEADPGVVLHEVPGEPLRLGLLGFLNGLVFPEGKKIVAVYDHGTEALRGFRLADRGVSGGRPPVEGGR